MKLTVSTPRLDTSSGVVSHYRGRKYDLELLRQSSTDQSIVPQLLTLCEEHGVDKRTARTEDNLVSKLAQIQLKDCTRHYLDLLRDHFQLTDPRWTELKGPGKAQRITAAINKHEAAQQQFKVEREPNSEAQSRASSPSDLTPPSLTAATTSTPPTAKRIGDPQAVRSNQTQARDSRATVSPRPRRVDTVAQDRARTTSPTTPQNTAVSNLPLTMKDPYVRDIFKAAETGQWSRSLCPSGCRVVEVVAAVIDHYAGVIAGYRGKLEAQSKADVATRTKVQQYETNVQHLKLWMATTCDLTDEQRKRISSGDLGDLFNVLHSAWDDKQRQISDLQSEYGRLQQQEQGGARSLEEAGSRHTQALAAHEATVGRLKVEKSALQGRIATLQEECDRLNRGDPISVDGRDRITHLESINAGHRSEIQALQTSVDEHVAILASLRRERVEEITGLKAQIDALQESGRTDRHRADSLEVQNLILQQQVQAHLIQSSDTVSEGLDKRDLPEGDTSTTRSHSELEMEAMWAEAKMHLDHRHCDEQLQMEEEHNKALQAEKESYLAQLAARERDLKADFHREYTEREGRYSTELKRLEGELAKREMELEVSQRNLQAAQAAQVEDSEQWRSRGTAGAHLDPDTSGPVDGLGVGKAKAVSVSDLPTLYDATAEPDGDSTQGHKLSRVMDRADSVRVATSPLPSRARVSAEDVSTPPHDTPSASEQEVPLMATDNVTLMHEGEVREQTNKTKPYYELPLKYFDLIFSMAHHLEVFHPIEFKTTQGDKLDPRVGVPL